MGESDRGGRESPTGRPEPQEEKSRKEPIKLAWPWPPHRLHLGSRELKQSATLTKQESAAGGAEVGRRRSPAGSLAGLGPEEEESSLLLLLWSGF